MDKNWSEMNKEMQKLIAKETTFKDGIEMLPEIGYSDFFLWKEKRFIWS